MEPLKLSIQGQTLTLPYKEHFGHLVHLNQSLGAGAMHRFQKDGYAYMDVPEIVGITGACENIDTLFKIGNHHDLPLFFTQTGQLALEQALQSFHAVCTVIHSGRDEEIEDERHLRQFRLTEEEFDCTTIGMTRENYDENVMYEQLLINIQKTFQSMIGQVVKDHEKIVKKIFKRDINKLQHAMSSTFLRITYHDAISLLNKNGYKELGYGDDLKAEHEAKIVALVNKKNEELPVFIMKYPKEIKFFNMKVSTTDSRVALSADLILPYAGESAGSAVREHEFEKLNERLITSKMYELHIKRGGKYEDFRWYLDIMKKKATSPHAGYGAGNERIMQYILGEKDIRNVSIFSLLNIQTGDWNKNRYGQAGFITDNKKHVLLSIGKQKNKDLLFPQIKQAAGRGNVIFYTTKKTFEYLKEKGVMTSQVYKVSDIGQTPNIADLLSRRVFDSIINIPTRDVVKDGPEFTDGKLIRKGAVAMGISLITDGEVAQMILKNL